MNIDHSEKRTSPRVYNSANLKVDGLLFLSKEGFFGFKVADVSHNGLGIIAEQGLEPGEVVEIAINAPYHIKVSCRVVWCRSEEEPTQYRVGLCTVSNSTSQLQTLEEDLTLALRPRFTKGA